MIDRPTQFMLLISMVAVVGCSSRAGNRPETSAVPLAGVDRQNSDAIDRNAVPSERDPEVEALVADLHDDIGAPLETVGTPARLDFAADPDVWVAKWAFNTEEVLREAARGLMFHVPSQDWGAASLQCYTFAIPIAGPGQAEPASFLIETATTGRVATAVQELSSQSLELRVANPSGTELTVRLPAADSSGALIWTTRTLCQTPPPERPIRKGAHTGLDPAWLQKHQPREKTGWELEDHAWRLINGRGHDQATAAEGRYLCAGDAIRKLIMRTASLLGAPPADLEETPCRAALTLTNLIPAPEESAPILVQYDGMQAHRIRVTLPSGVAYDSVLCFKILGEKYVSSWYSYAEFMNGVGRPVTWTTLGAYDLAPCQ